MDIAFYKDDSLFAATPPLEAVRPLLPDLATRRRAREYGWRRGTREALLIDVHKARACVPPLRAMSA
eukprot:5755773-Alexandrium_andersonii.AAC.1